MTKTVLGHIDCPCCGKAGGLRITHDKNIEPFGFCEDGCLLQVRFGGKPARVRAFVARYPWAASVTVTVPETAPVPEPVPVPAPAAPPAAPKPVAAPAPKPAAKPAAKTTPAAPAPAKPAANPWFQTLLGAK